MVVQVKQKILISACLVGNNVRYNASCLDIAYDDLCWLRSHFELLSVCPEVGAGLPIPRASAEILGGQAKQVLANEAKVVTQDGTDLTCYFIAGARLALSLCQKHNIKYAVLAQSSPSCGSSTVYDGHFTGQKVAGNGVTTQLLKQHGIQVVGQHNIADLKVLLTRGNV